ncbi:MAG TPA: alpha/beta fold hydrolase [Candidatus Sulfopaludibacter sp.]|jgi:acyl-coenzyme A synthetase/AMP-(fatty) acid ligase/thioesterase domain-containing protein/acyl carrier protein|nr:alpha/beta fold hydrolase [Candidatus Sulfopaludibacter sp.]
MTPVTAIFRSPHAGDNGFQPRAGFRPFDPSEAESTLAERFREVAQRAGAASAVFDGESCTSYSDLLLAAEAIAAGLRSRCGTEGGVVAICQPSARATVETMLGALLGGFAYFCIDPALPRKQIDELLQAAAPVYVAGPGFDHQRSPEAIHTRGPRGIAALYSTSGSTGEPKMVALSHRAILFDIGRQTNDLYLAAGDRFDSLFSFSFSAALATTFGALLNGAELHCHDARRSLTALPDWIAGRHITVSTMTVSMLRHICLLGRRNGGFPDLRLVSVGGEALHAGDVEAFRSVFPPSCVLQNAMASTETRTYAQYFVPARGAVQDPVPIGWPVAAKEVSLLDEYGAPVPAGSEGEVAVRSRYLANGYANDPALTGLKFQPQSDGTVLYKTGDRARFQPDGTLLFLGRTDSQVKIRGHRVELDAVARTVELYPPVRTAVVITSSDSAGNDRLVAYVVLRPDAEAAEAGLRRFLREQLAEYAIPGSIVFLPELPLNANFKVDRRRLPKAAVPAGGARSVLREIWECALDRPDVPDDAPFADLGGDSLIAVRILVAVNERFGCSLPPDALHRFPTLRQMAAGVDNAMRGEVSGGGLIVFQAGGSEDPFFFVAGLGGSAAGYEHLGRRLPPGHPAYGLNISDALAGPRTSIQSLAAALVRQVVALVRPEQRVVLVGYSFGGILALEMARQLRTAGFDPIPVVIDMPAVNGSSRTPLGRLRDILQNLPAWSLHEAAHFQPREFGRRAYGNLRKLGRELLARPAPLELDPLIYFGKASLPAPYQAFLTAMYRAMCEYVPGTYGGRMILLRAKTPTLFRTTDRAMGWQAVAPGKVEVHAIPGSHDTCVSEEHGAELALILSCCTR